jgi:hypothetical protein
MDCSTTSNKVVQMTNKRAAECFHKNEKGHLRSWVCMSCDAFVKKEKKRFITAMRSNKHQALFAPQQKSPNKVMSCCTCEGTGKQKHMKKTMLSPRACFVKGQLCVCSHCKTSVQRNKIPL